MLSQIIFLLFVWVVAVVVTHWGALVVFLFLVRRKEWREPEKKYCPKVAVILALRGGDPFLRRCLEGLLSQDYDNYVIRIVVDHPDDPVLKTVREVLAERDLSHDGTNDIEVLIVDRHRETCSLKCNSLLEAVERLDSTIEVVVTLDADTHPYPMWLAELVEPLGDDRFAVASGMRWYFPQKSNPGTLVRYLWNAAAFVQMYFYKIPWGGSLAIRRELFTRDNLIERWEYSFADDTSLVSVVRQSGKRIAYVTSVLMANGETCRLVPFFFWVRRQMLSTKLYHPFWPAILCQCLVISLPQILLVALMAGTAGAAKWGEFQQVFGVFAFYWGAVFGTLFPMESTIRKMLKRTNTIPSPPSVGMIAATVSVVPLTQAIYTLAVLSLFTLRIVDWRGVRYRLLSHGRVQLIEYKPFSEPVLNPPTTDSV
ncbi:MAG: glycosyltransferase family 2 protein [Planctomycetaceae bacterium]|nr:glycosyltransferase family 2 protein [Planctomycetaceae bacterium]